MINGNYVVVVGDVGEAVYCIGSNGLLTPEMLISYDWHYFWQKCVASETGQSYEQKIDGVNVPVINVRAIAHLVGLQMACKILMARSHDEASLQRQGGAW